jgi:hypothetical protein
MLQEVADSRGACGFQPRADLKAYEAGDRGRGVPLHEVEAHAVGKGVLHNLKAQPGFGDRGGGDNQSGGYEQGPGGAVEHCLHNPFRFSLSLDLGRQAAFKSAHCKSRAGKRKELGAFMALERALTP